MKKKGEHLASAFFRALKKSTVRWPIVDYGLPGPFRCTRRKLLVLSVKLSGQIRKLPASKRVGVVLPPGLAGTIATMGIFFAGRIPVHLNFSLGPDVAQKLIKKAGIETIITAHKMMEKFPEFPWTKDVFEISSWLKSLSKNPYRLIAEILLLTFPLRLSQMLLKIPRTENSEEATLLFTSGSSGEPKGVVLTHQNILSNCLQINRLNLFGEDAKILANLPLFHSFGFTVATCFPLLYNVPIVAVSSPLDTKSGLNAIRKEKVTFLLGTPTFLRGFLSKGKKDDFLSLRYVVAGAEKSPDSFKKKWEEFACCSYLEGYGLTETSPGVSFNLPGSGSRKGSVGRLFTEIECKTIHPETKKNLKPGENGLLCFRGPNVFSGYLNDEEKTKEVLENDKWFITGDLGYLDKDNFLFIEGRLSRFSKIGGEMVPHGTIEDAVRKIVLNKGGEEMAAVIMGRPDKLKGEQLVLVTDQEIDFLLLRKKLGESGLPNLWIPKTIHVVEEMPTLPTGKIDFKGLGKLIN
jgi:acyl-[acyl-carrier-protein]-phospholipid O-acyltransferase/long-chain-fatty-acid--[acyl-carrier-protein] ligase